MLPLPPPLHVHPSGLAEDEWDVQGVCVSVAASGKALSSMHQGRAFGRFTDLQQLLLMASPATAGAGDTLTRLRTWPWAVAGGHGAFSAAIYQHGLSRVPV